MPNFSTLIIDTMCLLHRAKHISCNPNKPGQQNCVIIGFLKEIKHLIETFHTDDLIFCFDSKKSIRKELFPKYQYKRHDKSKKSEEEIKFDKKCFYQFEIIKHEILPSMGFNNVFLQTKYEADDLIAKIVMSYPPDQFRFIIVSIDQDLFQLLDHADIYDPGKRKLIQYKDFWHEYKLQPKDWIDFKAIAGCFDSKTEILTDRGWLFFPEVKATDKVYSMNTTTGVASYEEISNLIYYDYNGEMFKLKGKYVDLLVTPNHKFFGETTQSYPPKNGIVKFKEIQDIITYKNFTIPLISKWEGIDKDHVILPEVQTPFIVNRRNTASYNAVKLNPSITINMNIWLAFLGIYLADGHVAKNRYGYIGVVGISATKQRKLDFFQPILDATPWKWKRYKNGWQTSSRTLANYLENLGICYNKYIPKEFLQLPPSKLQILFNAMMAGDGCCLTQNYYFGDNEGESLRMSYYSSSITLINSFQELCIKLGYATSITKRGPRRWNIKNKSGWSKVNYCISILKAKNTNILNGVDISKIQFDGMVYDVETKPYHTIFVRRNGHTIWSSNCQSDRVPGIAGVGKKSALAYLRGEEVKQQYLNKIEKGQDQYQFCKQLVQLPYPGTKLFKIQWNNFAFEPFKKICEKYHIFLPNRLRSFFINLLEDLL